MDSLTPIQSNTLTVRMAASAGGVYQGGLGDELRVPDDAIPYVIEYVLKVLGNRQFRTQVMMALTEYKYDKADGTIYFNRTGS